MASALGLFDGRFDAIKKGLKIGKVLAHAPPSAKPPRSPALLSIWGTNRGCWHVYSGLLWALQCAGTMGTTK